MYKVRFSDITDLNKIYSLYKNVAKQKGGIARTASEITKDYIESNLKNSINNGISFVIDSIDEEEVIAEIHCHKPSPKQFNHVLSDTTIVVSEEYQGQGLGKLIFKSLLDHVEEDRQDILRLELFTRESNEKAIQFYKNLGFKVEGIFKKRVRIEKDIFESDIAMAWLNKNFNV